jgi:hypothetical protein
MHTHGGRREGGLTEGGGLSPPHCIMGGCVLTGAERSGANELVRSLYDAVKPKLCYAYDRHVGAYLRMPT